jgi:hypothetical protein
MHHAPPTTLRVRTRTPWTRTLVIVLAGVILALGGLDSPARAAGAGASGTRLATAATVSPARGHCGGTTCRFYFSRAATASIVTKLQTREWTAQAAVPLVCTRLPHKPIQAICFVSFPLVYDHARPHLVNAYEQDGCFVFQAKLRIRRALTFDSASPGDGFCQ